MKMRFMFLLAAGLFLAGCGQGEKEPTEKSESSGNPLTAPTDYLGAVGQAKKTAEGVADTASISRAIQMFSVEEGRYPRDLNELVTKKYLPRLPTPPYGTKFEYNSANGQVRVVKK